MKKVFYLGTCSTCKRILSELSIPSEFYLQDIKKEQMSAEDVETMGELAGSYEAIFSRRSMQYRKLGLHEMDLTEADYKKYILQHYSFLRRPVIVDGERIFVGNSKSVVSFAKDYFA